MADSSEPVQSVDGLRIGTKARVWVATVDPEDERDAGCLDAAEWTRAERFTRAAPRREFIAAHVLLRRALSVVDRSVAPKDWRFVVSEGGRPELQDRRLRFSVSHTSGLVACVVATKPCGVDVERLDVMREVPQRNVLSVDEHRMVNTAPDEDQGLLFTQLWTVKESYAKACGLGMRAPFDRIRVSLDPVSVLDTRQDAPFRSVTAESWLPTQEHVGAVTVVGPDARITFERPG